MSTFVNGVTYYFGKDGCLKLYSPWLEVKQELQTLKGIKGEKVSIVIVFLIITLDFDLFA